MFLYRKSLKQEQETNRFLSDQRSTLQEQNKTLLEQLGDWDTVEKEFFIIPGRENRKIKLGNIIYVASDGNEVVFHTPHKKYRAWLRIKDLSEDLPERHFVRCHRSYIINIHHASFENNQYLLMSNGDKVSMTKTYKERVENLMNKK